MFFTQTVVEVDTIRIFKRRLDKGVLNNMGQMQVNRTSIENHLDRNGKVGLKGLFQCSMNL